MLGKTLKKYVLRYYQLKVKYGAIGIFLTKIGKIEIPHLFFFFCLYPV